MSRITDSNRISCSLLGSLAHPYAYTLALAAIVLKIGSKHHTRALKRQIEDGWDNIMRERFINDDKDKS